MRRYFEKIKKLIDGLDDDEETTPSREGFSEKIMVPNKDMQSIIATYNKIKRTENAIADHLYQVELAKRNLFKKLEDHQSELDKFTNELKERYKVPVKKYDLELPLTPGHPGALIRSDIE